MQKWCDIWKCKKIYGSNSEIHYNLADQKTNILKLKHAHVEFP